MNRVVENGILKMDADVFIIPNKGGVLSDGFIGQNQMAEYFTKAGELNNIPYDRENDKLVQLWFVEGHWTRKTLNEDDDQFCHNLVRHRFPVVRDTDRKKFYVSILEEWLPETYFKGHKEGDVINVKLPVHTMKYDDPDEIWEFTIDMNLRLNQQTYRYRGHGDFEEMLEYVTH